MRIDPWVNFASRRFAARSIGKRTQKRTIEALGLGKIRRTVEHNDTPQIRGMIDAVKHLVTVEQID